MTTPDITGGPPDRTDEELPLARVYRAGAKEQPSAAIDARLRAVAHAATKSAGTGGIKTKRWAVPFAIAATVVLSVSIVLRMFQDGVIETQGTVPEPAKLAEKATTPPPLVEPRRQAADEAAPELRREAAAKLDQKKAEDTLVRERVDRVAPMSKALEAKSSRPTESPAVAVTAVDARAKRGQLADVIKVQVSGSPGAYNFSVTIRSPDTGCAQYADWWEVVGADGKLLYRRVLLHSHADEQPFDRSGGPVPIQSDTTVWVRAHMNTTGYGGAALQGSPKSGFAAATPPPSFAADAATQAPLPDGCAF